MEEIIFLDAEIEEDDDLAPVGTLIRKGDEIEEVKEAPQEKGEYLEPELLENEEIIEDEQPVEEAIEDEPAIEEAIEEPAEEDIQDEGFLTLDDIAPADIQEETVEEEPVEETTPIEEEIEEIAEETAVEDAVVEDAEVDDIQEEVPAEETNEEQPIEETIIEEQTDEIFEEPIIEDYAAEKAVEENVAEEPIVEETEDEPVEDAAPIEEAKDEIAEEQVVEETSIVNEVKEEPIVEEKPVKKSPVKKTAPKKKIEETPALEEKEEKPVKKAPKKLGLGAVPEEVDEAVKDSSFEVKEEKKAKVITPKKQEVVDVWAVATIGKKEEPKPKKPVVKKPVEVKEEPVAEEKPAQKAPAKKKTTAPAKEINKNIEIEENKVEAKKVAEVKDTEEKILVDADLTLNPNPGKFVIKKTDKGNFVYKLFSFNFRVVAIGAEPYADLSSAKAGIKSVSKNAATAPIEDQTLKTIKEQKCPKWIVYQDKKGEFRLRLIASNGNIVATTNDGYTTKAAAIKGIEAIGRAANGAFVVRNDNLW